MKKILIIVLILSTTTHLNWLYCQDYKEELNAAKEFHKKYLFNQAISIYDTILAKVSDTTILEQAQKGLILSENGKSLLNFASNPQLINKEEVDSLNFFLKYPTFKDLEWIETPEQFHNGAKGIYSIMLFPKGAKKVVFSAPDKSGSWNILTSQLINDTIWSTPHILNEEITTIGNEIFPYISKDGKTLYFSSNGHTGMGGYDLYKSEWNNELNDWDTPVNLGFPYSSVEDDYLYSISNDSKYALFASNREGAPNKYTIYFVENEINPLKQIVNQLDAKELSVLQVKKDSTEKEKSTKQNNPDNSLNEYKNIVTIYRELNSKISKSNEQLLDIRDELFSATDSLEIAELTKQLKAKENENLILQQQLTTTSNQLQTLELSFLSKGIILTADDSIEEDFNNEQKKEHTPILLANNNIGKIDSINVIVSEPEIDLSFKILDKAVIADLSEFPSELTYQIQMCVTTNKASIKYLKGLYPIFERRGATGKYIYSVGIFNTYSEALKNLNTVKKRGFTTALITAYNNGKSLSIKNARALEEKIKNSFVYQVVISGYDTLPSEAINIIKEKSNKDIAKINRDGVIKFIIGTFAERQMAESVASALNGYVNNIEVEQIETK